MLITWPGNSKLIFSQAHQNSKNTDQYKERPNMDRRERRKRETYRMIDTKKEREDIKKKYGIEKES